MKMKLPNLVLIVAVVIFSQACASKNNDLRAEAPHPKNIKAEAKSNSGVATEVPGASEVQVGDNLTQKLSGIKVKDTKLKTKSLSDLIANKSSLLVLVKPGCVFCESLLAVMDTLKPTIKPQVFFILDKAHASEKEFKEKYSSHSNIKATWIYDYENKFHEELAMSSFPRLLHLDAKQVVVHSQTGLVLPVDLKEQEALKKEAFPVLLQKLSQTTVAWMQGLL